jgi:WhiB family transcriptional regulator, redox-sensing transcriptional regulator
VVQRTAAAQGWRDVLGAHLSRLEIDGGTMDTDWMSRGKCKDLSPAIFFPSDGVGVQSAQRICAECPVSDACLQYALEERVDHGVWGGKSERERRRILRRRRVGRAVTV